MSKKKVPATSTLDMLRSLYDFKPTYAKTLGFKENDYFILHSILTKHKNWWEVMNDKGEIGYVPSNYVEKIVVTPAFYLQFVDKCLDCIKRNEMATDVSSNDVDKKVVLDKLNEMKVNVEHMLEVTYPCIASDDGPPLLYKNSEGQLETIKSTTSKCSSNSSSLSECRKCDIFEDPIKPVHKMSNGKDNLKKSMDSIHETYAQEEFHNRRSDSGIHSIIQSNSSKVLPVITHHSVYELIENVRINTQLSHEMSRIALVTVVQGLHELLPASVFPYLSTILSYSQESLKIDDVQIEQTHDASRLKIIFNELTSCKEDSQQRSWMLHEDESVIKEYLRELIQILTNADASISKHVVSSQQYHVITTLIQYYQMETRWSIRQLLLQAFGVLCSFDKTIVSIMLNSILPGELARDMMASPRNVAKLNYSSLLLTMIMSMGEPVPITHYEYLGVPFVTFVLDNIECPPDTDADDQIPELFTNLIIAYNLQFQICNENIILKALSERSMAKALIERLLLLLNREEDPVRIFDHEPKLWY
ncbi:SPIN90/Ldb17, leucine-rich domain [Popillia japonica]|uniref:SPIN90/Ldb17, leucine-rich domain n=1 Tax=Popillia japonica TaxID=7064 RepID=A0AAW1K076_POPJA